MVFIFSARCGTEYVGLAWPDHLTPCSTLSRCNMHQTLPWLPCFRFSKGIIIIQTFGISATDIPCRGAAHTFPSSITIPCLICNHPVKIYRPQTNTSWRSSWPLIIPKECFECFVSSKIFHIFSVKNDTFYTKKISPYWYSIFKVRFGCLLPACQSTLLCSVLWQTCTYCPHSNTKSRFSAMVSNIFVR